MCSTVRRLILTTEAILCNFVSMSCFELFLVSKRSKLYEAEIGDVSGADDTYDTGYYGAELEGEIFTGLDFVSVLPTQPT